MRWSLAGLLAGLLLSACGLAAATGPEPVALRDAQREVDVAALARTWMDTGGTATITQAGEAAGTFQPSVDVVHRIPSGGALWMHLRLARAAGEKALSAQLAQMSLRTRRPIRFIEKESADAEASGLDAGADPQVVGLAR